MAVGNPRTWIPYMNSKDCSQGFCSLYCPQWCYIVYPPPPPFEYPDDDSSPNFSPLLIAIIGILATAFLVVSYYTLISKYCGPGESARRDPNDELQDSHNHNHEPWHASTTGLDEALIKSIAVFKYKKGDGGSVGVTDCSVCLGEFQDDESVRLLPKCSHVFHLPCIDTWLKSHSSCPLCRASIFTVNAPALQVPTPEVEVPLRNETSSENETVGSGNEFGVVVVEEESIHHARAYPKPTLRAFSDLSSLQVRHRVIEIRDEVCESIRSVSMEHLFQSGLSVADVLQMNEEEYSQVEGCSTEASPSTRSRGDSSKSSYKTRVLHCVLSPIAMKRSFSSGIFSVSKSGRGRHGTIPI
ncbi:E3 ubiquitin-protein ligase RNF38/44 [Spatholobus suberectus]|nr:E3 ubiquitin-protein ligase RNF38/44 [Spatholobus suberectus]